MFRLQSFDSPISLADHTALLNVPPDQLQPAPANTSCVLLPRVFFKPLDPSAAAATAMTHPTEFGLSRTCSASTMSTANAEKVVPSSFVIVEVLQVH
jgi:hypothetical protein